MLCLGFDHGTSEWQAQTNPLSYGGRLHKVITVPSIPV